MALFKSVEIHDFRDYLDQEARKQLVDVNTKGGKAKTKKIRFTPKEHKIKAYADITVYLQYEEMGGEADKKGETGQSYWKLLRMFKLVPAAEVGTPVLMSDDDFVKDDADSTDGTPQYSASKAAETLAGEYGIDISVIAAVVKRNVTKPDVVNYVALTGAEIPKPDEAKDDDSTGSATTDADANE